MAKKITVCSSVCNSAVYDYRVLKFAETLSKRYNVIIIGTKDKDFPAKESRRGFTILRGNKPFLTRCGELLRRVATSSSDDQCASEDPPPKSFLKGLRASIADLAVFLLYLNKSWVIYKVLRNVDADIYIANDIDTLIPTVRVAQLKEARVIYDTHELCVEEGYIKTSLFKKLLYKIEHKYIAKVDVVFTVNSLIARELKKLHGLKDLPRVIYNYPKFLNARDRAAASKGNSLRGSWDSINIIYQGVYSFGRGLIQTILAMKSVDGAVLYLRGFGEWERKLRMLVDKNNLKNKVRFLTPVRPDKIVESLLFADIGIFTPSNNLSKSIYLSSPNKLYQYIMAGLCVITSDLPTYQRIVSDSGCGILIHKVTPEEISRAINMLVKDKDRIKQCKKNSLAVAKNYCWESQEPSIYKTFKTLEE
jgi:glycosyltransferase involved in cell wall biosynthesis